MAKELHIYPVPSAFQIRFGGCKGVVAQNTALGNEKDALCIRSSMKKFESDSSNLEILEVTRPGHKTLDFKFESVCLQIFRKGNISIW